MSSIYWNGVVEIEHHTNNYYHRKCSYFYICQLQKNRETQTVEGMPTSLPSSSISSYNNKVEPSVLCKGRLKMFASKFLSIENMSIFRSFHFFHLCSFFARLFFFTLDIFHFKSMVWQTRLDKSRFPSFCVSGEEFSVFLLVGRNIRKQK